jgi:regulator of protease activity HflC (stomatin/prohibitin superfamily)
MDESFRRRLNPARVIPAVIVVVLVLIMASCAGTVVDPGHRGVKVTLGKVSPEPLEEGLHFMVPLLQKIVLLDIRTLRWAEMTQSYTKDVQQADVSFTLTYSLEPSYTVEMYRTVGADWSEKLIGQVVFEELKRELGQHEAVTLIATRDQAARAIEAGVRAKLADRHILVSGLQITNIDYTKQFEDSVEAKVIAQQRAIEEQNRTVQIEQQATQKVISATAEAESMRIRANALESNPRLVEWEAVQKWDGKLPQYQLGGATPFINLSPPK